MDTVKVDLEVILDVDKGSDNITIIYKAIKELQGKHLKVLEEEHYKVKLLAIGD